MNRVLAVFFMIMFMIGTDTFLISPLLPTLQQAYHVSTELSGWMVSSYALGYAGFALVAGPISDGLNRKKVMVLGMSFFAISTFFCGIAPSFLWMLTFRFLAGVSAAFVSPQVWASIPLLIEKKQIVKAIGVATAGLSISQILGLPLGAYLATIHYTIPFYFIGILSALLVILIYVVLPEIQSVHIGGNKKAILQRYKQLLTDSKVSLSYFAYFVFQTGNFAAFSFFGVWLSIQFGLQVDEVGTAMLVLGLGNLIGNIFGPRIVNKIGYNLSFYGGIIFTAVLYVLLPHVKNIVLVELLFFALFFVTGILFVLMMRHLQNMSSVARGTGAALANASMYIGQMIGAAIAGMLFAISHNFILIGSFTALLYIGALFLFRKSEKITENSETGIAS
ncbi:MFS transporter [Bacillus cereus ATCC 10876]|uniref:MFS transporter n=1 Tax=Bacillus thuringiensis serovar kumamotoensis TaxID=132267 RepID=A0A9X6JM86_BACUK|nr:MULTISPECIES: MFS transporter [Bacillus]MDJ0282607.1 MFS transporter [Bacillus bombysepticus]KFL74802.1 sugar (and other) transporter family protein [Bacillus cereus ATCC 10876]MBG9866256.1 MFS transporter [Bacillus cereus]MBO1126955.1 MFS transporter [Bacillus cereus]MCC2506157.1 MFS transporter [Bacillus cereus]